MIEVGDFAAERLELVRNVADLLFALVKTAMNCDDVVVREKAVQGVRDEMRAVAHRLEWFLEGQLCDRSLDALVETSIRLSSPSLVQLLRVSLSSYLSYGAWYVSRLEKIVDEQVVDTAFGLSDDRRHVDEDDDTAQASANEALREAVLPLHSFVKRGNMAFADFASCAVQILMLYALLMDTTDKQTVFAGVHRMRVLAYTLVDSVDCILVRPIL